MSEVSDVRKAFEDSLRRIDELIESMKAERNKIKAEFERRLELVRFGQVDWERFEEFFEEPYVVIPKRPNEWYVIAPKWLNFQIGWLERATKGYNIFVVNQYVRLFSSIPSALSDKFQFKEPLPVKVYDGMLLTGKELQGDAWEKYKRFLSRREGEDRIRIKKGYEFRLIAQMIEDGTLPFLAKPVVEEDLREWDGLQLRGYQKEAWREFLSKGAIGVFWAFGSGKSLCCMQLGRAVFML